MQINENNGEPTPKNYSSPQEQNFIKICSEAESLERETDTSLCCCEFIDRDQKRYHLFGCCCNCVDFDRVFTDIITCRRINTKSQRNMLLTFQDRLRIPWRGGAKQVSAVSIIPVVVLPMIIAIAAINKYAAYIMFLASITFLSYAYYVVSKANIRTRFFFIWLLWSVLYMILVFELVVPLLELLPEEHSLLAVLTASSIFFFWRTKRCASLNHVTQSSVADDELPDITEASTAEEEAAAQTSLLIEHDGAGIEQSNICSSCHKYMPPRTDHCFVCGVCIKRRDHHSYWLDCCIGERNHRYYIAGLIFAGISFCLGSNLTLTAVCHPFLLVRVLNVPIMLPDDCSEIFDDYELGISFIIAVYAWIISAFILVILTRQVYLISRGITMQEWRRGQRRNRQTIFQNWRAFSN